MTHTAVPPWYRQFWPWFLLALPAAAVVAGITTLLIASYDPDGIVVDDYYKQGLAINQDLDRDHKAAALRLRAQVQVRPTGTVRIALHGLSTERVAALHVYLLHPTKAGRDQHLIAQRGADGNFHGTLQTLEPAHWYLMIEPMDQGWRLNGRLAWPRSQDVALDAASRDVGN